MKFSVKNFFSKCNQCPADLAIFTEEIFNGHLHLCGSVLVLKWEKGDGEPRLTENFLQTKKKNIKM